MTQNYLCRKAYLLSSLVCFSFSFSSSFATTFSVSTSNEFKSAISSANNGDTIEFASSFSLAENMPTITKNITIRNATSVTATVDGTASLFRALTVSGATVTLTTNSSVVRFTNVTTSISGGGTVVSTNAANFGDSTALTLTLNNGTVKATSPGGGGIGKTTVSVSSGGGTFDTNGVSLGLNGAIQGSGSLQVIGGGTLNYSGAFGSPTLTGSVTLNTGIRGVLTPPSIPPLLTNNGTVTVSIGSAGMSYSGNIEGTGDITFSFSDDTRSLTISGTNTYTGGSTVAIVSVTGATTPNLIGTTSSLQGDISSEGIIAFNQSSAGTYSGSLSGTGGVVKQGTGNVTFSGVNSYLGGTTVSAGTLTGTTTSLQGAIVNNAVLAFNQDTDGTYSGSISGTGSLTKLGTGNVTLGGSNSYSGGTTVAAGTLTGTTGSVKGSITNNATVVFDQSSDGTYSGTMTGSGSLVKSGTATLTLSAAQSYLGGTTISSGILSLSGSGALSSTGVVSIASSSTFSISGASSSRTIGGLSGSGVVTLGSNSLTVSQSSDTTFTGTLGGSGQTGNFTKSGTGTLDITGATLSYTGTTTVSGGSLLATTTEFGSRDVSNNSTFIFNQNVDGTYSGALTGSGSVTKQGTGKVTLSHAGSNYSGGTLVSTGILSLNGSGALSSTGSVNVEASGEFSIAEADGDRTIGDLQGSGTMTLGARSLTVNQSSDGAFTGTIGGSGQSGGFTKAGTGALDLTGATINYSGDTTISAGALVGTTNEFSTRAITNNSTLTFTQSFDGTYSGAISGSGVLVKEGSGNVTLGGTNSYSGGTTVSAGTLTGTTASLQGAIDNNAALIFDQSTDGTYSGDISGTGSLRKRGTGKVILGGTSSYSGSTTVSEGALSIQGSIGSAVTVESSAFLKGTGVITGDVQFLSGSTLAPGNSIGTLSVTGDVHFSSGSTYECEVNASNQSDLLAVTGNVTVDEGSIFSVVADPGLYRASSSFTVMTTTGQISNTFTTVTSTSPMFIPTLTLSPDQKS